MQKEKADTLKKECRLLVETVGTKSAVFAVVAQVPFCLYSKGSRAFLTVFVSLGIFAKFV